MEKTSVFNLIILDESGSMSDATKATISGCNEVINVAKSLQEEHADTQRSFVSIYAFQSGNRNRPSRYICKNVPAAEAHSITLKDYEPWGATPLYDAIGATLVDLKAIAETHEDATAVVTIITDGYENDSRYYTLGKVAKLISQLKELGWTFNFIGANIDVDKVSAALKIDNAMTFDNTELGTTDMFDKFTNSMRDYEQERIRCEAAMPTASVEDRRNARKVRAKRGFFKK